MSTTVRSQLQGLSSAVSSAESAEERAAALAEAFDTFVQETSRLDSSYRALQLEFQKVNVALEDSNRALNHKVQELNTVSSYLSGIVQHMTQGLLFVSLAGDVTTCNPAAETILGISGEDLLLRPYSGNFADDAFGFSMKASLSSGAVPGSSYATWEREGSIPRELEVSTSVVCHGDAALRGVIVLLRDITELRRLQHIASRNDRMKELGEMAAAVAHEIRNPLGGIKGFAALLCRDLKDKPEQLEMAKYIVDGTSTLDRLVTEVLDYSRPVDVQLESTELLEELKDVSAFARAAGGSMDKTTIDINSSLETLAVPLDRQLFRSAVLNLLVNAAQAMPDGGTITLDVTKQSRHVNIAVSDTGAGISPENLENIFSPFFTTKPEGNGFGLSQVYKIIQAHGGSIDVSSCVGRGTTFSINIPLKA